MENTCECFIWERTGIGEPYNFKSRLGHPLITNHHPNCNHFNDSLMDVWKVSMGRDCCYVANEQDAKDTAGEDESGEVKIVKEKMHREIFENLPEFEGF